MWRLYTKRGTALRLGVRDLIPGRYYCLGGTHRLRELGLKDKGGPVNTAAWELVSDWGWL